MNRAQDSIAARLRKEVFESLLTKRELEWFQFSQVDGDDDEEKKESSESDEKTGTKDKESAPSSSTGITPAAVAVIMKDDVDVVASTVTNTLANVLRSSSSCIFGSKYLLSYLSNTKEGICNY